VNLLTLRRISLLALLLSVFSFPSVQASDSGLLTAAPAAKVEVVAYRTLSSVIVEIKESKGTRPDDLIFEPVKINGAYLKEEGGKSVFTFTVWNRTISSWKHKPRLMSFLSRTPFIGVAPQHVRQQTLHREEFSSEKGILKLTQNFPEGPWQQIIEDSSLIRLQINLKLLDSTDLFTLTIEIPVDALSKDPLLCFDSEKYLAAQRVE
jgi:hypothetical protein